MQPTMDIIFRDGRNKETYPGTLAMPVSGTLPEYRGGVTMTINYPQTTQQSNETPVISVDPEFRGGVPCVGAARLPISNILQKLSSGRTPNSLASESAGITIADVQLALEAAAWIMRDPSIDWQSINLPEMIELQRELQAWESLSDETLSQL